MPSVSDPADLQDLNLQLDALAMRMLDLTQVRSGRH